MARPPSPKPSPRAPARGTVRGAKPARPPITPTAKSFSAWPRWKKFTVTGLFATVIVSGTIWGAALKMRREAKAVRHFPSSLVPHLTPSPSHVSGLTKKHAIEQETKKIREATTDEKVYLLEQRRAHLVKQKHEIESKLSDLHARMKVRESGLTSR